MTRSSAIVPLLEAVDRYFALMYDSEMLHFDQVFASSAQLHGLQDAELRLIPAQDYKKMLASRSSPKSKNAPRLQEILLVDFASPTQAIVKVRVRIDAVQFLDYLSYHRIKGEWLITAKSFHRERTYEVAE
jgi:hypothetical protein